MPWLTMSAALVLFCMPLYAGYHVSQLEGNAVIHRASEEYSIVVKPGRALKKGDLLCSDFDSKAVLEGLDGAKLVLASKTKLSWTGEGGGAADFSLTAGGLKALLEPRQAPLQLALPFGKTSSASGLSWTSVNPEGQAWIELEAGELTCSHRDEKVPPLVLQPGEMVLLDEYGIHKLRRDPTEREKFHARFRLLRNTTPVAASPEAEGKPAVVALGGGAGQDGGEQGQTGQKKKREPPKDGRITMDGHGADIAPYSLTGPGGFLVYLVAGLLILILGGIGIWVVYRRRHKPGEENGEGDGKDPKHEHPEHDEDIYVWRGNLTSHNGTLKTEKVTHILGDVESGAIIEAGHKLVIRGNFQGATLRASDHVTVQGGINGQGKGVLEIAGSLKTSYINEACVRVGGDIDADQGIRNSKVCANGEVRVMKKTVMGSTVSSNLLLRCQNLGSDFCNTEVILGKGADAVWRDTFKLPLSIDFPPGEDNPKATMRVYGELVSTLINMGNTKLDQHKSLPGPIMALRDPTQPDKLQLRGFRKDEEPPITDNPGNAPAS